MYFINFQQTSKEVEKLKAIIINLTDKVNSIEKSLEQMKKGYS